MAYGNYIKVKLPAGEEAVVMTALLPFYASMKATISDPTEEEVFAAFPEERAKKQMAAKADNVIETLKQAIRRKEEEKQALLRELAELKSEVAKLTDAASKKEKSTKSK